MYRFIGLCRCALARKSREGSPDVDFRRLASVFAASNSNVPVLPQLLRGWCAAAVQRNAAVGGWEHKPVATIGRADITVGGDRPDVQWRPLVMSNCGLGDFHVR